MIKDLTTIKHVGFLSFRQMMISHLVTRRLARSGGGQEKPVSTKSHHRRVLLRADCAYCLRKLFPGYLHSSHGLLLRWASVFSVYWWCGVIIAAEWHRAVQQKSVSTKGGLRLVFLGAGGAYCLGKLLPKCIHNRNGQVLY